MRPQNESSQAQWQEAAYSEAWQKAKKVLDQRKGSETWSKYQADPIGFCRDALGDTFTDDVEKMIASVRDNAITIARSANGVGKSLPVETRIPTPEGWKEIGMLRVGDCVFDINGMPTRVIGVYPQGEQPTYSIKFNDDTEIRASADHLWAIRESYAKTRGKPYRVITTKELKEIAHRKVHIPICDPVEYPQKDLPVPPYTLGVLLGDGGLTIGCRLTSADDHIIERVKNELGNQYELRRIKSKSKTGQFIIGYYKRGVSNPLVGSMRSLGLMGTKSDTKFIPKQYLVGSVHQRKNLLNGLFDTDGYIGKNHSIVYTTISEQLANDIRELVWSLGGTAKIRGKMPHYKDRNGNKIAGKKAYNIYVKLPFSPFSLPRKNERYIDQDEISKKAQRIVTSVDHIGDRDSLCISVDNPTGLFLADSYIVTHNSYSAARLGVFFLICFPDSQVWLTAAPPERNLKDILWAHILDLKQRKPKVFSGFSDRRLKIQRSALSFIEGVSIPMQGTSAERESKFSGKHSPHLIFIVDEGDAVPEEVYKGIESCMSSEYVRLLILFNPRSPSGIIYEMEKRGKANVVELSAFRHPNVITGRDVIPGAVSQNVTVRRINEWTRPLSEDETNAAIKKEEGGALDENLFDVPDFLVGATAVGTDGSEYPPLPAGKRKVMESAFLYMVLGKYPGIGSKQLIADIWIDAAATRWKNYVALNGEIPPAGVRPVLGADIAEFGGDNNCCAIRYGGYVPHLKVWGGLDADLSADMLLKIYLDVNAETAKIDGLGVGSVVAPRMVRLGRERGVDISAWSVKASEKPSKMTRTDIGEFYTMRDEIGWRTREWLRSDPTAMVPPDPMLIEELKSYEYDFFGGGKIKLVEKKVQRTRLKRSPDRADALMMTFAPFERALVTTVIRQGDNVSSLHSVDNAIDDWRKRQNEALIDQRG